MSLLHVFVYISVSKPATLFGLVGVYGHTSAGLLTKVCVLCLRQAEETAHLLLLQNCMPVTH